MQRYELEAWLGDDHGLTADQITELLSQADDIEAQYPNEDDALERDAALYAAYRLAAESDTIQVIDDYAEALTKARSAEVETLAALRQAAVHLVPSMFLAEADFARRAGVDRMTVRKWLGKRPSSNRKGL